MTATPALTVGTRVFHDAADADAPDHGTIRLITTDTSPGALYPVTYVVEWDRQQGSTDECEACELNPLPADGQQVPQPLPGIEPGVRVEGTMTYQAPGAGAAPREIIRRGTYTGPRGGTRHTVRWDGSDVPEAAEAADFRAVHPDVIQAERRATRHTVGDRVEWWDGTRNGRVLETATFFGSSGLARTLVRVAWTGERVPDRRWHEAAELYPMHGAQLAAEYGRRRRSGQSHAQAMAVYHGDIHRPAPAAVRNEDRVSPLDR
ncbi:hypothetical protein OG618_37870 (plasmid) [Kitasatospora sp. NBC_01246]|uniref:hypothetical protein n=1 Tax=Kitasatospora sp. NBC_01246 TaxID=2903570 RepID=UPI002E356D7C|nr:hypothetical protein [Kitasatospora sp. NBC_01246]